MNPGEFFSGANPTLAALTGGYIAAALVVWRKGADLGHLKTAQEQAILGIVSGLKDSSLIPAIREITDIEPRLLMPAKPNRLFQFCSIITIVLASIAVFQTPITKLFPFFEKYGFAEVALAFGCGLFSFWVMAGEYRYLTCLQEWRKKSDKNSDSAAQPTQSSTPQGKNRELSNVS